MNEKILEDGLEQAMKIEPGLSRQHTSGEPITLRPHGVIDQSDSVQKMLASTDRMLRAVRKSILEAESQYRLACSMVIERCEDELARLRMGHTKTMADLDSARRKVEAMRDA